MQFEAGRERLRVLGSLESHVASDLVGPTGLDQEAQAGSGPRITGK
jgi:hypothetical protein